MNAAIAFYLVGAAMTALASRQHIFRPGIGGFLETWGVCALWPLPFVVRIVIFVVEGNLWKHLDD